MKMQPALSWQVPDFMDKDVLGLDRSREVGVECFFAFSARISSHLPAIPPPLRQQVEMRWPLRLQFEHNLLLVGRHPFWFTSRAVSVGRTVPSRSCCSSSSHFRMSFEV